MSSDGVPLYLGIPLVILCLAASVFVIAIAFDIWRHR